MTQIIEEVQLDYCDVMIKPKRSTLNSRSEIGRASCRERV